MSDMKRIYTIIAIAASVFALVSCGNSSNNNNGNEVSDAVICAADSTEVLPAGDVDDCGGVVEVKTITRYSASDPSYKTVWEFTYGEDNKLVEAKAKYPDDDEDCCITVSYADNMVTVEGNFGVTTVYEMGEDGTITSVSEMLEGFTENATYKFTRGCIASAEIENSELTTTVEYKWEDGELIRMEESCDDMESAAEYSYSEIIGSTKVNVIEMLKGHGITIASLFPGCASRRYPSSMVVTSKWVDEPEETVTTNYKYEINEDGYVTKLMFANEKDGWSQATVAEITYIELPL